MHVGRVGPLSRWIVIGAVSGGTLASCAPVMDRDAGRQPDTGPRRRDVVFVDDGLEETLVSEDATDAMDAGLDTGAAAVFCLDTAPAVGGLSACAVRMAE